ncbi:chaperone modulator CbpM [Terrimonas rubra]|uniref:Chaperone modulator CbpM n=1 Tax=Terrimonas rubra TaxID=1035890 RepID=A0ABW6A957_9BACT
MQTANNITIQECCTHYRVETSFVYSLQEYGLIEIIHNGEEQYIHYEQLALLEKYMHLHYDLDINFEGLDAIAHLLRHIENLQTEVKTLRNELGT